MDIKQQAFQLKNQGKSLREIANKLGKSKSTIANYVRESKAKFSVPPPQNAGSFNNNQALYVNNALDVPHLLPPGKGSVIVPGFQQFSGIYSGGAGYFLPGDLAVRQDLQNARNMWQNLICRSSLQERLYATALQEWHIEPDNEKDLMQQEMASCIQKTIQNIPDFVKFKYCLLKSRWFGKYACQIQYGWNCKKQLIVNDWEPINGDSIVLKQANKDFGVYVTPYGQDTKKLATEAGYVGRVHRFQDGTEIKLDEQGLPYKEIGFNERQAVVLMIYDPDPSDFLNSQSAETSRCVGLRSTIYPSWYAMTTMIGWLSDYMERFGTGVALYKYLRGNQASYEQARPEEEVGP